MRKTIPMFAATVCAASLAFVSLIVLVGVGARQADAANTTYTVKDLGKLPGNLSGNLSRARDINESDQVVGETRLANGQLRAFLYESSGMKDLGTFGGNSSRAFGINDAGQVVGEARLTNGQLRAFLYENGQKQDLGTLLSTDTFSSASGVNNSGEVVGESGRATNQGHAFLCDFPCGDDQMEDLGTLGGAFSGAININDAGKIVGWAQNAAGQGHAFLCDFPCGDDQMEDLGTLPGGTYAEARDINESDQVVGTSKNASGNDTAFLYEDSRMKDLGTLGGDISNTHAINDYGQIVGWSQKKEGQGHAFIYEDGTMVDLNDRIPEGSGWVLGDAFGINASGKIVGVGPVGGEMHAFLLTPNDITDPYTTATISPEPNAAGWNNEDVTVTLDATDEGGSNVKEITYSINGDVNTVHGDRATFDITTEGENTITYSATDHAENTEVEESLTVRIDKSAPEFLCDQPDDAWHADDVTLDCTASDGGSGLADSADGNFSLSTNVAAGEETDNASTDSKILTDAVGNSVTAGPIGGNKVDKKAPVVSITTSPGGNEYELGDDVTVSYACTDGGSGTASCSGTVASGGKLDTTRVGKHNFTVEASDEAGNVSSKSLVYNVIYDFDGFFSPVDNLPVLNLVKAGGAIPIKFSLSGDQGLDIFASADDGSSFPRSGPIPCNSSDPVDAVEQTVTVNSSGLTYDAATDLYTYVWKTQRNWTGCRQLVVRLADGKEYRANFEFFK